MLKERKQLWYTLSLQTGLCRWVVYQIIFLPTMYCIGPLVSTSFIVWARVLAGKGMDTSASEYKIKDDF